ncbi:ion channel [Chitinophaga sp.]|uniref:ion channel n=1 Tax=Chitinophaga sp. TaxID=1869181 RepID=UPI0031D3C75D
MALLKHINPFSKTNEDTGFSATISSYGDRFINKDGSFNLRKEGNHIWNRYSLFHIMLNLPTWAFVLVIVGAFILVNLIYTSIYLVIGAAELQGIGSHSAWGIFKEVYYFSTETFTTVGYGRVNPVGDGANFVASIEAMSGFLSFAVITGLIYGRFARPKAHLAFSNNALITPFKGGSALMFRFACYKDGHTLTDVTVQVNAAMQIHEDGKQTYRYYELPLERHKIQSLPMNWTVVHVIDEQSPLLGFTAEDIKVADLELYVLIKGFNDIYSNVVQQRTSYTFHEIIYNHKFVPMYRETAKGTVLEMQKLHTTVEVEANTEMVPVSAVS